MRCTNHFRTQGLATQTDCSRYATLIKNQGADKLQRCGCGAAVGCGQSGDLDLANDDFRARRAQASLGVWQRPGDSFTATHSRLEETICGWERTEIELDGTFWALTNQSAFGQLCASKRKSTGRCNSLVALKFLQQADQAGEIPKLDVAIVPGRYKRQAVRRKSDKSSILQNSKFFAVGYIPNSSVGVTVF